MDVKQWHKRSNRFFAWIGLLVCSWVVKVLPSRLLYGFARGLASIGYVIAVKQRRIAMESLQLALGQEYSAPQLRTIARECFLSMAKSAVEIIFLLDRPELLRQRIDLAHREHLDAALAKGKGVILVSAHFGNFPLLLARLSLEGYRTVGIMRPMRDQRVERIFFEKRRRFRVKTIYSQPRMTCVHQTLESLRQNEMVFIPLDQNFGTAGVFVRFFGRQAATATGPVVLAQRTNAVLLPCFILRQADDRHTIVFEPQVELVQGSDARDTIQRNVQRLTDIIEHYIRRYPGQWGWIHRRWKSAPPSGN